MEARVIEIECVQPVSSKAPTRRVPLVVEVDNREGLRTVRTGLESDILIPHLHSRLVPRLVRSTYLPLIHSPFNIRVETHLCECTRVNTERVTSLPAVPARSALHPRQSPVSLLLTVTRTGAFLLFNLNCNS